MLLSAALLLGGSASSAPPGPQLSDKVLHAIAFGLLVLVAFPAARRLSRVERGEDSGPRTRPSWVRPILWASAYSVALGVVLELWQATLPYRDASVGDVVADVFGACLAAAFLAVGQWWLGGGDAGLARD